MKKCVKCGMSYDDSVLTCPDCHLYLIANVVSDLPLGRANQSPHKSQSPPEPTPLRTDSDRPRRRPRVVADQPESPDTVSEALRSTHRLGGGFRPSVETATPDTATPGDIPYSRNRHSQSLRRFLRRTMPMFRFIVPAMLIAASIAVLVLNWSVVYNFLRCCIIGAIIGGGLLTILSVTRGHHFSVEVTITGAISGMIISCILAYNWFGVATGLSELLTALAPCIIMVFGIMYMFRSLR